MFDEHATAVYRHCFFRLMDEQGAQDVMQETFIRFWTYLAEGKQVANPRAFLYTTANRLIIDLARKNMRRPSVSLDSLAEEGIEFGGTHLADDIAAKSEAEELRSTLGKLKEPYRSLLVMRYLDGMQVAEIARVTGRSAPVVSVQLHRAVRKLRTILNNG